MISVKKPKKLRPPYKIHGGKYYLSSWVIQHFPKNYEQLSYIEPFAGAISVLLNKEKSNFEAVNDLDLGVIQILRSLRDESKFFINKLKKTTYSERVFKRELKKQGSEFDDYMKHAVNEFVVRRMSRGGIKKNFAWSSRPRGGQPGDLNAWETIISQLPIIAERIEDIFIFNEPAVKVIKAFSDKNTLCYADPTYLAETRVSKDVYDIEMDTDDHIELAAALKQFKGKVVLSGYPSTLYKRLYKDWKCVKKKIVNHASQQKKKED